MDIPARTDKIAYTLTLAAEPGRFEQKYDSRHPWL